MRPRIWNQLVNIPGLIGGIGSRDLLGCLGVFEHISSANGEIIELILGGIGLAHRLPEPVDILFKFRGLGQCCIRFGNILNLDRLDG